MNETVEPSREGSRGDSRFFNVAMTVLFVGMVVVTGLLIKQNRDLKSQLASLQRSSHTADVPRLETGDVVEPFTLLSLGGKATRLEYSEPDSETLLLFFSPDCPACNKNFANWQRIEQSEGAANRRVVFISTAAKEKTREYVASKELRGEVVIGNRELLARYKVSRIPTTIQVGAEGVVLGIWVGVLPEAVTAQLQDRPRERVL